MIDQNTFLYQQWKQNQVKRAYVHYANTCLRLQNVARCLATGGDPSTDPDVKDDYFYLISEYGEDITLEEANRLWLQMKGETNG